MQSLRFDNAFVRHLPADSSAENRRRQVHGALYSHVQPTPVASPRLIAHSREMAQTLGISEAEIHSPRFAEIFGGNTLLEGMQPFAANYGGQQVGQWGGPVGDGGAAPPGAGVH